MSYYKEYIEGLCCDSHSWVVDQICDELDSRDKVNVELSIEFLEYKNAMEYEMGSDWTKRILKQYREKK